MIDVHGLPVRVTQTSYSERPSEAGEPHVRVSIPGGLAVLTPEQARLLSLEIMTQANRAEPMPIVRAALSAPDEGLVAEAVAYFEDKAA